MGHTSWAVAEGFPARHGIVVIQDHPEKPLGLYSSWLTAMRWSWCWDALNAGVLPSP